MLVASEPMTLFNHWGKEKCSLALLSNESTAGKKDMSGKKYLLISRVSSRHLFISPRRKARNPDFVSPFHL